MKINEATGLYDNYNVWHIPFWQTKNFVWGIKIIAALLLFFICIFFIKMYTVYKNKKKLSIPERLLADLYVLKKEGLNGKEFYVQLSDIIKQYFFYCHHYDVLGKTDTELIDYLCQNHGDNNIVEEVKSIVRGSEIVKFANAQAAQERMALDFNQVVAIIKKDVESKG